MLIIYNSKVQTIIGQQILCSILLITIFMKDGIILTIGIIIQSLPLTAIDSKD